MNHSSTATKIAETYGYGFLATFLISLCSVLGIAFFSATPKRLVEPLTGFLSSMAVGALSGDAILHLIPTALGIHSHDEAEQHARIAKSDPRIVMLTVLIGIYTFYLIDFAIDNLVQKVHAKSHQRDNTICDIDVIAELHQQTSSLSNVELNVDDHASCDCEKHDHQEVRVCKNSRGIRHICRKTVVCLKEISAYAWCLLLADAIHNFADGVALGAAFAESRSAGITMSLAVLFHELPHELGDYAVLIRSGLSKKRALVMNILTGLTSFAGLFLGAAISTNEQDVTKWVLALTAGIFLYVSLTSILPEVSNSRRACKALHQIAVYVSGITLGMIIMALLAFFEENMRELGKGDTTTL